MTLIQLLNAWMDACHFEAVKQCDKPSVNEPDESEKHKGKLIRRI